MIYTKLMPHQEYSIKFCQDKNYAGIFYDYGTGKTLIALALIEAKKYKRVLVISTKTAIKVTWPSEIKKHTNFQYVLLEGAQQSKIRSLLMGVRRTKINVFNAAPITLFLINFDGIKDEQIVQSIIDAKFDCVIVDESTKIKSPKTKRTQWCWLLARHIENRFILTGFPATEGLHELYSQIKFLDHGEALGKSYWSFLGRCFVKCGPRLLVKKKSMGWITEQIKPFCIRATNTILKLPPAIYKEVEVLKTVKQAYLLKTLNDYFRLEFGKVQIDTPYVFTLIQKCLQICDGFVYGDNGELEIVETEKDDALVELVEEINPAKNKIVIWCTFKFSLVKIYKLLQNLGYNPLLIKGDTPDIDKVVSTFRVSPKHNILVASLKKAHESITLTECRYAIYYSNYWSHDVRANSEARIRRKGSEQHESIIYTDLVTKGSIETKVHAALRQKKNIVSALKQEFKTMEAEND